MNVTIIIATELAEFLETRGVLEQYKRNIENDAMFNLIVMMGIRKFVITEIGVGFLWSKSPEGHDFWAKLHHEYSKVLMFQLQKN